ncbi:OmpA family protein [Rhodobacteraceae bacterium 2CG4]|uniref:OmpA family protein n=1 Tax=Halovulum marinum TaxID=2662447 RepID=A0A6L5Z0G1_9RHOB|nr:OmpA family protein [Halovulum marinum]MSU89464.1 OmpA family protein [Halovulum marinum]
MTPARAVLLLALALGGAAAAQTPLSLPAGAVATHDSVEDPGRYALPTGRFGTGAAPALPLEGRIHLRAWRLPDGGPGPLALARALRRQLEQAGFEILLDCAAADCGGFDYRIGTRVLPPPAMEVSLTAFHALSARRGDPAPAHLNLLISRSEGGGWVQAIEATPGTAPAPALVPPGAAATGDPSGDASDAAARPVAAGAAPPETAPETAPAPGAPDDSPLLKALRSQGRVVLDGVDFAPGARRPDAAAAAALEPLAAALRADPGLRLMLVGHSDDTGTLAANIALSRARAAAVRTVLVERFGIDGRRLEAQGAGFLAPRAPNTSDAGRARNRRVEAVLR